MEENKFINKILERIEDSKISPRPKWYFKLKNYSSWILAGLSLILASGSLTLAIYFFDYSNLPLLKSLSRNSLHFLTLATPYSWVLLVSGAIVLVYKEVKHTSYGYRYSLVKIALISVSISIILGTSFYFMGLGKIMDNILIAKSPFYSTLINPRAGFWFNPSEGRLMGIVMVAENNQELILIDINKNKWVVDTSQLEQHKISPEGLPIKLIGKQISNDEFQALRVVGPGPEEMFIRKHRGMEENNMPMRINKQVPRTIIN